VLVQLLAEEAEVVALASHGHRFARIALELHVVEVEIVILKEMASGYPEPQWEFASVRISEEARYFPCAIRFQAGHDETPVCHGLS
jgi:hypothetical protein